jgi:hypothetical protein
MCVWVRETEREREREREREIEKERERDKERARVELDFFTALSLGVISQRGPFSGAQKCI